MNDFTRRKIQYIIVGGGIAALSCAEELSLLDPSAEITLVSASKVVKAASNLRMVGRAMETFDIIETSANELLSEKPNISLVFDYCAKILCSKKEIQTKSGKTFQYDKLCLATGGKPKLIAHNNLVIGIRDTESVKAFQSKLASAKRIIIVGNGGIASELAYELKNIEIIWAIKHKNILATFIDAGAAQFLISQINKEKSEESQTVTKRLKYSHAQAEIVDEVSNITLGSALGPDWTNNIQASGSCELPKNVHVEFECEVDRVMNAEDRIAENITEDCLKNKFCSFKDTWPVYVRLTNGKLYGCDFIISATGIIPNNCILLDDRKFDLAQDGGIIINDQMQTNVEEIYAAGDLCTPGWKWYPHWIQMRLWTQARQMGAYTARCMHLNSKKEKSELDLCFEIFTHVTNFFGFKIVLLGLFNSQNLRIDHEAHVRIKTGEEYVKVLVQDGKVQGAILVGETDLEETMENLILNGTDVTGLDLLNNTIDIEDYFD